MNHKKFSKTKKIKQEKKYERGANKRRRSFNPDFPPKHEIADQNRWYPSAPSPLISGSNWRKIDDE